MHKVFDVELSSENGSTELALPAAPYAMLDALEKLRLEDGEAPRWEILRINTANGITPYLDHENGSLFELNALCQQLALLDEGQLAIVEGLAAMGYEKGSRPIPMPQLIDMAYSTDCCHLVEEATNDYTLGRFCAENGFVPEADDLSDEAFEQLDFAKIGREFRQNEGGVLTSGGYVQKHDELRQVCDTLNLVPQKPDYAILVATASGCEVKLPVPLGEPLGDEPVLCVDCAAPALTGLSGTMSTLDMLAHRLTYLTVDGEMPKYKALLEATGCDDIRWALALADGLEQYAFSPNLLEPEDSAMESLKTMLPDEEVKLLAPHVDLLRYGQAVLEQTDGQITSHGLIQRTDGQPIQGMNREQMLTGGMDFA